jgi:SSS family solute:Na+ symporter
MAIFAAFGSLVVLGPLSTPDQAVPLLLGKWLPWWLVAIMMTGAIAAASSTVDSLILSGSQYVFNDWVFRSKRYNPRNFKFIGRLITLIMVIVSSLLSLKPPSYIYDIQNRYFYPGMSQVMPAVFAAMYWPRANKYGAIAGMVVGSSLVVLFDRLKIASILGIPGNFVAFILNIVLLVVISLVTTADVQKARQKNLLQTSGD